MFVQVLRQLTLTVTLVVAGLTLCSARAVTPATSFGTPHARLAERLEQRTSSRALEIFLNHRRAMRDSIVRLALAQVGTPYEMGGVTPDGFDCSGLVRYVFSQQHLMTPRVAERQARIGTPVRADQLRPGDLLTFGTGARVTHIGIYVGDRKFVHASSVAGRVIVSPIDRPPSQLIRPLKGARRIIGGTEDLRIGTE